MSQHEAEIVESEQEVTGIQRPERREMVSREPSDMAPQDSLLADAMRVEGLSLADRLLLMDKIEGIYLKRQEIDSERQFYDALSEFQEKCPVIEKKRPVYNKDGSKIRYYYADLGDIVKQVGPLLASCGLSYDFSDSRVIPFEEKLGGPYMELTCNVHHSAGHSRGFPYRVVIEDNEYMSATQHGGEANSYARRYGFTNAFGILTADNDFDGNRPERLSPQQARAARQPVSQPQARPTAQRAAAQAQAATGEKVQITPAATQVCEASTVKVLQKKLNGEDGGLSVADFKKRFPAFADLENPLAYIKPTDLNSVMNFIADPASK